MSNPLNLEALDKRLWDILCLIEENAQLPRVAETVRELADDYESDEPGENSLLDQGWEATWAKCDSFANRWILQADGLDKLAKKELTGVCMAIAQFLLDSVTPVHREEHARELSTALRKYLALRGYPVPSRGTDRNQRTDGEQTPPESGPDHETVTLESDARFSRLSRTADDFRELIADLRSKAATDEPVLAGLLQAVCDRRRWFVEEFTAHPAAKAELHRRCQFVDQQVKDEPCFHRLQKALPDLEKLHQLGKEAFDRAPKEWLFRQRQAELRHSWKGAAREVFKEAPDGAWEEALCRAWKEWLEGLHELWQEAPDGAFRPKSSDERRISGCAFIPLGKVIWTIRDRLVPEAAAKISASELAGLRRHLDSLRHDESIEAGLRDLFGQCSEAADAIEKEAMILATEGCWYLASEASFDGLVHSNFLPCDIENASLGVLAMVDGAVESLMEWYAAHLAVRPSMEPVPVPSTDLDSVGQQTPTDEAADTMQCSLEVTIARGQDSFVLTAEGLPNFTIPVERSELLRLFAAKVACGSPGETVGFNELNWSMKGASEPGDESKASDALRTAIGQINKALVERLGTPNDKGRWIVSKKGQGYHLNQSIQWRIEDADLEADLTRYSRSVWTTSVDPTTMQDNTPLKGQQLPATPRRYPPENDSEDD